MKELGITKGEWKVGKNYNDLIVETEEAIVAEMISINEYGDAALIADAGNTAQKCGLLPSELLKQRDELLAENQRLKAIIDNYNPCPGRPNPRDVNPYDSKAIKRTRNH